MDRSSIALINVLFLTAFISVPGTALSADEKASLLTVRGTAHIHTVYSHDSNATLGDVLEEMRSGELDFAIITDHNSLKGKSKYEEMKRQGDPLLLFANEISGPDGHLIALGVSEMPPEDMTSQALVDWIHERNGYAIIAHPVSSKEPWSNWEVRRWDGFEVYNFGHELYDGDMVGFGLSLYSDSDSSVVETVQQVSDNSRVMWNQVLTSRPVVALAGSNAHLRKNRKYFRAALMSVTLYALVPDLNEEALTKAVGQGHSYMVFESRGRARGFSFTAMHDGSLYNIGDTVPVVSETVLHISLPESATIRLLHKGQIVQENTSRELSYPPQQPGAYRAEVYKENDLWIFTNPIYIA